jgi:hypothetical protein
VFQFVAEEKGVTALSPLSVCPVYSEFRRALVRTSKTHSRQVLCNPHLRKASGSADSKHLQTHAFTAKSFAINTSAMASDLRIPNDLHAQQLSRKSFVIRTYTPPPQVRETKDL